MCKQFWNAQYNEEIISYFNNDHIRFTDFEVCFDYLQNNEILSKEYFNGLKHHVPSTPGIWVRCISLPSSIRICLVFLSVIEAMCFSQCTQFHTKGTGSTAIASIGIRPSKAQIHRLKAEFPNTKFYLVFGNDVLSRVLDCAVALWLSQKDAVFKITDNGIKILYKESKYFIENSKLSLSYFQKTLGLRTPVRTRKPPKNYLSFKEMLFPQKS